MMNPELPNILRAAVAALESPAANDDYTTEKLGKAWDGLTLALIVLGVHPGDLHDGIDRAMLTPIARQR